MSENTLLAGAGRAEIQFLPEDFPLKAFTGVHDSIHVRVLLLERGLRLALVSLELTSLPAQAVEHFRKVCANVAGVEEDRVLISVTHTFSAPHIPSHISTEQERCLSDTLYQRIDAAVRAAAEQALSGLGPAEALYGEASCVLNVNRNVSTSEGWWIGDNEEGLSNHAVRVLTLRRGETPYARIVNYDVQPSVMDKSEAAGGGRLISGDLAGAACRALEAEEGGTAIFLPGCAGDQAPILRAVQTEADGTKTDLHEAGFVLAEQQGRYLARRAAAAGGELFRVPELNMRTATAHLPEQEMKYETKQLRPHTQYSFDLTGNTVAVPLILVELGPVGLLTTTPELNSGFGQQVREILGRRLMIATLVNGGAKYLPEEEDFAHVTYAAMNTKLGPGSTKAFLQTAGTLLR